MVLIYEYIHTPLSGVFFMEKENRYNRLWEPILGKFPTGLLNRDAEINSRYAKRVAQCRNGYIPQGMEYADLPNYYRDILGPLAPRVLLATNPNSFNLLPEQLAAAGGWCALRTADMVLMSERGSIMNPENGMIEPVKSVRQFTDWIRKSPTFDQAVECVGPIKASEFPVISETRLWSKRAIDKLARILDKALTTDESSEIEAAISDAEDTRELLTNRYLQACLENSESNIIRYNDYDISKELKEARNKLLRTAGLQPNWMTSQDPTIPNASLVWAMYSEPYFDMLRRKKIIESRKVLIVEPAFHAYPETQPHRLVTDRIYQEKGIYFDSDGLNPNTGFVAFIECLDERGFNIRRSKPAGLVPNISNWEGMFYTGQQFDPYNEASLTINPTSNPLFLWGLNIYPCGKTLDALFNLIKVQQDYKELKSLYRNDDQAINAIKRSKKDEVASQNLIIALELKQLFEFMTDEL